MKGKKGGHMKQISKGDKSKKPSLPEDRESPESLENSVVYIKDKKTGEWKIKNPAGSTAYNIIIRDIDPSE